MTRTSAFITTVSILAGLNLSAEPPQKMTVDAIRHYIGAGHKKAWEFEPALLNDTLAQLQTLDEKAKVELWLAVRAYFEKQIDPKFDPADVPSLNIAPKNGLSGVAPDSVADPVEREAYIKAIAENQNKAKTYLLQKQLRKALLRMDRHAAQFFGAFDSNQEIRTARAVEVLMKHGAPDDVARAVATPKSLEK